MDSTNTTEPAVHEALKNVSWLIGRWKGTGSGKYPTIQSFSYDQELVIGHCGNPFLSYQSNSWHSETKVPMHSESGFVRVHPETNKVAFVTAHNTGIATIEEGDGNENELNLSSNSVQRISFAKAPQVIKVKRAINSNHLQ